MSTDNTQRDQARKPYSAPAIEESGSFQRLVLACGQGPGHEFANDPCDPFCSDCDGGQPGSSES